MNVLWITNTIFPDPSKALNLPIPSGGGWMFGLAQQMVSSGAVNLNIATVYSGSELRILDIEGVKYYLLPRSASLYQKQLESYWEKICGELNPDVIHIHGTEYTYGLACMRVCPNLNYVVSIQGLLSVIARYYCGGIAKEELFRIVTAQRLLKNNTIINQQKNFVKRSKYELEILKTTKHVIGFTHWDHSHMRVINPTANYYTTNRILRGQFYTAHKWDIKTKADHTIFVSQAEYPLKGLHQALKAIYFLKAEFPDIKLRVAGHSIIKKDTLMQKVKISEYGVYINQLISKLGIHQNIAFTGILSEAEIISEYQKAHVFVCSSSIENDSTSIGEAQLLGVPCISSYVGGTEDSIKHGESGFLYRFEEAEMLAEYIRSIFTSDRLAEKFSEQGIIAASERHDKADNLKKTLAIYQKTLSDTNP